MSYDRPDRAARGRDLRLVQRNLITVQVVHVSLTPLAGSPIRIVSALNRHTSVRARLVDRSPRAYESRTFPEDLVWSEHAEEAKELIARADVVHFHHWFDFGSRENPFGFDFIASMKRGARHLVQWHSSPSFVAKDRGVPLESLLGARIPQMVMAQYHERYYPSALPVPLIVEHAAPAVPDAGAADHPPRVLFSPSRSVSAHADRWETKGKPEVAGVLRKLADRRLIRPSIVQDLPFAELQRLMAGSDVVVDDVATGSFHTTSLEALCMGKPTVAYLDSRVQSVLAELTGSAELPIVNAPLGALERVLTALCGDRSLLHAVGSYSLDWMRRHYREADMVSHYVRGYERLLETGTLDNPAYREHGQAKTWLFTSVPDAVWASRRRKLHQGALATALGRSASRFGLRRPSSRDTR